MKKVDERNDKKIKRILSENPHLSYAEATRVLLMRKEERRKNKLASARTKKNAKNGKKGTKRDAMYQVLGGGFETNRRKH
ncbi:hypothetical protein [Halomonas sp. M4R1S46]|uniref:hypothetical protein n=1 Tax=Halomonas sp. M4R1S46 TaxID=2982692 RepID=UPI0021E3F2B6|nr:hypothetical protein [Halomonas sp. M4R1S46]UYG06850.1 hypothetical protein OCT48_14635 [Halomonas sp. M4R1S46]